ncbi:autotransporter-associated beta strand repeat-containing protein, partial [Achromobacter ruhlandii]
GTLRLGDGGVSGSVAGPIFNNAALVFDRSDDLTFPGLISGTGAVTKQGANTLTLTANNDHTGGTTIA